MPPTMSSFSHRLEFKEGRRSYLASTSYSKGLDTFEVRSDQGAVCSLRHTPTTLTMDGGDEKARRFTLRLVVDGNDVEGELDVAGHTFRAKGPKKSVVTDLLGQVASTRGIKSRLPASTSLAPVADQMKGSPRVVALMVGHGAAGVRKTYCESVCDCCAGGGWMAPWCCISCASCDVFEVDLADKFQALTRVRAVARPAGAARR